MMARRPLSEAHGGHLPFNLEAKGRGQTRWFGQQKSRPKAACFAVIQLERARRFERPTLTLARLCSTPELRPHRLDMRLIVRGRGACKGENALLVRIYSRTAFAAAIRPLAM